jgi:hypothetical protein
MFVGEHDLSREPTVNNGTMSLWVGRFIADYLRIIDLI